MREILIYKENTVHRLTSEDFDYSNVKSSEIIWLDIENPTEEDFNYLRNTFGFHKLAVEDCEHRTKRPKVDDLKDYYFMVLTAQNKNTETENITYGAIYIFLGANYIVTVHYGKSLYIDKTKRYLMDNNLAMSRGADFVFYSIFDYIVDEYFLYTENIETSIDYLQEEVMRKPDEKTLNEVIHMKRRVIRLKRNIAPLREVLNSILRIENDIFQEKHRLYFSDIYDHILRIYDMVDSSKDMLSGCLELYSSQISNKTNDVMKVLTIITTIMAPVTVISGIYGMNFDNMPELHMKYGYLSVWIIIAIIVVIQLVYLRKKKWL